MNAEQPSAADLSAYVDGSLDEPAMAEIERYLDTHPDAKAEVRAYVRQKQDIRAFAELSAPSARSAGTDRLAERLDGRLRRPGRFRALRTAMIAVAGIAVGWLSANLGEELRLDAPVFVDEAAEAHTVLASVVAGGELAGDYRRLLVAISRLGAVPWGPDLSSFGFDLVAVNVVPTDEGAAIQHIYRSGDGKLVSFFGIRGGGAAASPRIAHRDGLALVYWGDAAGRYALAGEFGEQELGLLAAAAHSGAKRL